MISWDWVGMISSCWWDWDGIISSCLGWFGISNDRVRISFEMISWDWDWVGILFEMISWDWVGILFEMISWDWLWL